MRAVQAAVYVLVVTMAGVCGQASLSVGPDALWRVNDGIRDVAVGSVIQVFCTSSDDMMWLRNGSLLHNDPPHIRIRVTSGDGTTVSILTIDNFGSTDRGIYVCETSNARSSELQLTAVPTSTLHLIKQPADNERNGDNPLFNLSNDFITNNRTALPTQVGQVDPDNTPEAARLMQCIATQVGGAGPPNVTWIKDGVDVQPSNRVLISTDSTGNCTVSFLTISDFGLADAGVYQCVCTSGDGVEVVTSFPYRLGYGDTLYLSRVTPEVIVIDPPEKLILEVDASGGYLRVNWERNGVDFSPAPGADFPATPERFVNFWDTYVHDPTDSEDLGLYRMRLAQMGSQDTRNADIISFSVFPYETPQTITNGATTITAVEGSTVELSCTSEGIPTPTIAWKHNGAAVPLSSTDQIANPAMDPLTYVITSGRISSTLRIPSVNYPSSEGQYECVGSNEHGGRERSAIGYFTILVHSIPEVTMDADPHPNVHPGQSVTMSCVVTRGDPSYVSYAWTFTDQDGQTLGLLGENSGKIVRTNIQTEDYGTYRCTVSNNAGSATTSITISVGVKPAVHVVNADTETMVAFAGEEIALSVNITNFNIPITITWTHDGVELTNDTDNVIVLHTGLDTPPATSTLVVNALRASDSGQYQVTARNPAGGSTAEFEVSIYDTTSALFRLRLILDLPAAFDSCADWLESSPGVTEEIVSKLMTALGAQCQCSVGGNIFEEQFSCGSKEGSKAAVIFRGLFIQTSFTGDVSASDLLDHLQTWVARAENFEVAGAMATVDQSCQTAYTFNSDDCEEDSDSDESSAVLDDPTEKLIVGVLLGVCALLLLTTSVLFVVAVMVCRRKRTSRLWLSPGENLKLHDYPLTVFPPRAPEPTSQKTVSHDFPKAVSAGPRVTLPRENQPAQAYPTTAVSTASETQPDNETDCTYEVPGEVSMPGNTSLSLSSGLHVSSLPRDTASEGYYSVPSDSCYSVPRAAIFVVKCGGESHDFVDVDQEMPEDYDNPRSLTKLNNQC